MVTNNEVSADEAKALTERGFQPGDTIEFIPVSNGHTAIHVISNHRYRITYILSGWGLKNGYVALGIEEVKNYD